MADPHLTPTLDAHDRLTVRLYRAGIGVSALGLAVMSASYVQRDLTTHIFGRQLLAAGATLSAWNLHLYDRRFRWIFQGLTLGGLLAAHVAATATPPAAAWLLRELGVGLHLAFVCAVALKEQLCFRVPLLQAVPLLLVPAAIAHAFDVAPVAGPALGLAALILGMLAGVKAQQPLGHDIGDRAAYQV
jgi:uncharacterized integral membrane protein